MMPLRIVSAYLYYSVARSHAADKRNFPIAIHITLHYFPRLFPRASVDDFEYLNRPM